MSRGLGKRQIAILKACRKAKAQEPTTPWNWWRPINHMYDGLSGEEAQSMSLKRIEAAYATEQESWRRAAKTLESHGFIERKHDEWDPSPKKRRPYGDPRASTITTFVRVVLDQSEKELEAEYWREFAAQRQAMVESLVNSELEARPFDLVDQPIRG